MWPVSRTQGRLYFQHLGQHMSNSNTGISSAWTGSMAAADHTLFPLPLLSPLIRFFVLSYKISLTDLACLHSNNHILHSGTLTCRSLKSSFRTERQEHSRYRYLGIYYFLFTAFVQNRSSVWFQPKQVVVCNGSFVCFDLMLRYVHLLTSAALKHCFWVI